MLLPSEIYQNLVGNHELEFNSEQLALVTKLDELTNSLKKSDSRCGRIYEGCLKLVGAFKPAKGLYVFGGVGCGKTMLIDLFYHGLPTKHKKRIHFHRFMQLIHQELNLLQGDTNPIPKIIKRWSRDIKVLCLDELFVSDISDAMILAEILNAIFSHGIYFITTTNLEPDQLYRNGLQRDKFLPAIRLIKQHCDIFELNTGKDYRLRLLKKAEIYHFPLDEAAEQSMQHYFKMLAPDLGESNITLMINHRDMLAVQCSDSIAWFEFETICKQARSVRDYIELATLFHTILISNVPVMTQAHEDIARRFINMVDEFYDKKVTLIISAEASIDSLYQGSLLQFDFQRTCSRLQEMQTTDYLSKAHLQ